MLLMTAVKKIYNLHKFPKVVPFIGFKIASLCSKGESIILRCFGKSE